MIRIALLMVFLATPALAVEPDEILADPTLEARARVLSKDLRCLVCRNENIDESNAELARDLRILVRERLVEGDSDEEAIAFLVNRFGEFVLLNPTAKGANLVLWLAAPVLLITALGVGLVYIRRRAAPEGPEGLSAEEEARLKDLLGE